MPVVGQFDERIGNHVGNTAVVLVLGPQAVWLKTAIAIAVNLGLDLVYGKARVYLHQCG